MFEGIVFFGLLQAIVFGSFSAFVASEKNRNSMGWFLLGFFFSFIALIAVCGVPKLTYHAEPAVDQANELKFS